MTNSSQILMISDPTWLVLVWFQCRPGFSQSECTSCEFAQAGCTQGCWHNLTTDVNLAAPGQRVLPPNSLKLGQWPEALTLHLPLYTGKSDMTLLKETEESKKSEVGISI